jgi:hypothetical protein
MGGMTEVQSTWYEARQMLLGCNVVTLVLVACMNAGILRTIRMNSFLSLIGLLIYMHVWFEVIVTGYICLTFVSSFNLAQSPARLCVI